MYLKIIGIFLLAVIAIFYIFLDMIMELSLPYMILVMVGLISSAFILSGFVYKYFKNKKNKKK